MGRGGGTTERTGKLHKSSQNLCGGVGIVVTVYRGLLCLWPPVGPPRTLPSALCGRGWQSRLRPGETGLPLTLRRRLPRPSAFAANSGSPALPALPLPLSPPQWGSYLSPRPAPGPGHSALALRPDSCISRDFCPFNASHCFSRVWIRKNDPALAGLAQRREHRPVDQRLLGSIPDLQLQASPRPRPRSGLVQEATTLTLFSVFPSLFHPL